MEETIDATREALNKLKDALQPLKDQEYPGLRENLDEASKAKLSTGLAFTIASLYYVALSLEGKDPHQHSVIDEIGRIKGVVSLLNQVKKEDSQPSKRPRIDRDASQRLIVHHL